MNKAVGKKKLAKVRLDNVPVRFWTALCNLDSMASLLYLQLPANPLLAEGEGSSVIVNVEGAVKETFRKADQRYFQKHPDKKSYVRYPFPDEEFPNPQPRKVRVIQVAKGTRIREPIW